MVKPLGPYFWVASKYGVRRSRAPHWTRLMSKGAAIGGSSWRAKRDCLEFYSADRRRQKQPQRGEPRGVSRRLVSFSLPEGSRRSVRPTIIDQTMSAGWPLCDGVAPHICQPSSAASPVSKLYRQPVAVGT